jgi:hypothetical protein
MQQDYEKPQDDEIVVRIVADAVATVPQGEAVSTLAMLRIVQPQVPVGYSVSHLLARIVAEAHARKLPVHYG